MLTRKTTLAVAVAAITFSMGVSAEDKVAGAFEGMRETSVFDSFVDDSTFSIRLRANHFDLSPRRGNVTKNFSQGELADLAGTMKQVDPNTLYEMLKNAGIPSQGVDQLKGLSSEQLTAILKMDEIPGLGPNPLADPATLEGINTQLGQQATDELAKEGDVRQGGVAVWTHFKSGYLFDFIGFDVGSQSAKMLYNPGSGSKIVDNPSQNGTTMSRVSIANVKMRLGDEDKHLGFRKGKIESTALHFGRDPNEWLLDKNYDGAIINGKWDNLNVYGMEIEGFGDLNKKKFQYIEDDPNFKQSGAKKSNSLGFEFSSDYGNLNGATTWTKNYARTTGIMAESGIPLSLLGMDVPEGKEMDRLIVLSGRYSWQKAEDDFVINNVNLPDHKSKSAAFMVGLNYDSWFAAVSYLKVGKKGFYDAGFGGGGSMDVLAGETLINDWDRPNQQTITGVISYDWSSLGLPGMSTNLISAHASKIDMDQVRKNGDLAWYLTGKDSFHETLFDVRYTWQDGPLEGLNARFVAGAESGQAELKGLAMFLTYDAVLF